MSEFVILALAFLTTLLGVAIFRRLGKATGMLDVPNERSSHDTPTLRGGGVVIVAVCLFFYIAASFFTGYSVQWTYVIGGLLVAIVSVLDDIFDLPAIIRFVAHAVAAVILIAGVPSIESIYIPISGSIQNLGWIGLAITFVWIVWLINAYNFMDGIDGIAGIQAVVAGLAWAIFGYYSSNSAVYCLGALIAFSSLGFLVHNWSPARVFMGDVGSAFLGFTFAALPLLSLDVAKPSGKWVFPAAISFVWLFLFDSIFTFARRALKGEKVWLAHREHLYQQMVISGRSHSTVSLIYGLIAASVSFFLLLAFVLGGIWEIFLVLSLLTSSAVIATLVQIKKIDLKRG